MSYDVAIIGGGLAGLSLSLDLRKRGYAVVVIEKGAYPRHKVCGEYISMESHRYLHTLCPSLSNYRLPMIQKFRLTSTGKKEFTTNLGLGGFGISRYLLEELLYTEALKEGVVFLLDTKAMNINYNAGSKQYDIVTKTQTISASLVCNSSGRRSNLENLVKKKNETNYVGIKYHVQLPRDPALIEIHNFDGGYCGISDIEDEKSCLCYIVNAKELNAVNKSIPGLEKRILSRNENLKRIFDTARFIFKEPVTVSGINFLIKEPFDGNTFFLGDSAGSIAPVTGNGMSMGLRSASALAYHIDHYFSGKINKEELEGKYTNFWNTEFSSRIRLSRHFQKLSEYPSLAKITIGIFNIFPPLARMVINQTHGKPF
jgi:flavin-dependent dehydrogenase